MGAGASTRLTGLPDQLTALQAKEYCGLFYEESKFNKHKGPDGMIDKTTLQQLVRDFENEGIREKFSAISPFEKDLWDPLLKSFYYREIIAKALPTYIAANQDEKRKLLLQSYANLPDVALRCECCGVPFASGKLCLRERTKIHCGPEKSKHVWDIFDDADPNDVAIHLWTYSMGGKESFYRKVNTALLNEDTELLQQLCYIICGVVTWINAHVPDNTEDIILYRGTPISESQEHSIGDALDPRYALADFIDPADIPAVEAAKSAAIRTHERAKNICRMPMFLAASESLEKAQEFTWIRKNGISCPIFEFKLPPKCDGVAHVEPLSHFPEEREYLLSAYSPVEYKSQRLEYLEIGFNNPKIKLVMVVTYQILGGKATFEEFESTGQDLKSAVILCMSAQTAFLKKHKKKYYEEELLSKCEYGQSQSSSNCLESALHQKRNQEFKEQQKQLPESTIPGVDDLALELQLGDEANDEDRMKTAIAAFVTIHLQNDVASILAAFHAFRSTEGFLEMKNRLSSAKHELPDLQLQRDSAQDIVTQCQDRLTVLHEDKINLELQISELWLQINDAESDLAEMKKHLNELREEMSTLEKEIINLETDLKLASAALNTWCQQLAALRAEERQAYSRFWERKVPSSTEEQQRWEAELKTAGDEYIESVFPKEQMEKLESNVKTLEDSLKVTKDNLQVCTEAIAKKEFDITNQETLIATLKESVQKLEETLKLVQSEIEGVEKQKEEAEEKVLTLSSRIDALERIIAETPDAIYITIRDDFIVSYASE